MDKILRDKINYLFISIDGEEAIHDKYRGKGTFRKIVNNIHNLRSTFKGETIGRLTITNETSVNYAVLSLTELVDHVFWQIQSTPSVSNLSQFKTQYKEDIQQLLKYWVRNIERGIIKNIVPFQAISRSLLLNERHNNLRCGCGTKLKVMDLDNRIYLCDELLGEKEFCLNGQKKIDSEKWSAENLNPDCKNCDINHICGGRCLQSLLFYPKEKFLFHCDLTKFLVQQLNKTLPVIREKMDKQELTIRDLTTYVSTYCTEEIP